MLLRRLAICMLAMCMAGCETMTNSERKSVLLLDAQCSALDGGVGVGAAAVSVAASSAAEEANKAFLSPSRLLVVLNETESPADSTPLEDLLERLRDGELSEILAVLYPGCTADTAVIAELLSTTVLQIPLITFAFPAIPTHSLAFPYLLRMLPSEAALPPAMQAVVRQYGWRRAAVLTQDVPVFTALRDELLWIWGDSGVEVVHQRMLSSSVSVGLDSGDLFGGDARIYVLNMYPNLAREVLCNARHVRYSSGFVWITHGWYEDGWWRNGSVDCTGEQLETYLDGAIGVTHYPTTDEGIPGIETEQGRLVYDAVWAVGLALNNTAVNASREEFREELNKLSFDRASGPVSFQNGVRTPVPIRIIQYRHDENNSLTRRTVALVQLSSELPQNFSFSYQSGEDVSSVWPDGVPSDGTPIEIQHYPFVALMVIVYLCVAAGVAFTVVCLVFNIVFREKKLIRLASPKLNYLIIVGAIILYLSSLGFFYPEGSSSTYIESLCNLRTFGASLGNSICYGTINAKMWRVYYICSKPKPSMNRKVPLKDWHLMLVVLLFVLVDTVIMIVVLPQDNVRHSVAIIDNKQDPGFTRNDDGIKEVSVVSRCYSSSEPIWLGVLFGYKIIVQAIGVYLAFKIRKVKIRGLNESKEVSAILYITSTILAVMIITSFVLGDYIDVDGFIFGIGLCTATTVVLVFTFVTKMWGLYRDPEGKHVLEGPTTMSSSGPASSDGSGSRQQVAALQTRIRELERQVQKGAGSAHNGVSTTSTLNSFSDPK